MSLSIARVVSSLAKVGDLYRAQGLPPEPSGLAFPVAMVKPMLDRLAEDLTEDRLRAILRTVVGDPVRLDGPADGWRASGYLKVLHVLPATPLVGWTSLISAVLVKSRSLVKLSRREPCYTAAFLNLLQEADTELRNWIEIVDSAEDGMNDADAVVAYGRDATIERLRGMVKGETPFFAYGSRFSVAIVNQNAPEDAAARLATDVVRLYQSGCLSPAICLTDLPITDRLAEALDAETKRFPARPTLGEATAVRREREAALFDPNRSALGPDDLSWTIIQSRSPQFEAIGAFNLLQVCPLEARTVIPWQKVQAIAVEGIAPDWLAGLSPSRICRAGEMQMPGLDWPENGRSLVRDLIRWTAVER